MRSIKALRPFGGWWSTARDEQPARSARAAARRVLRAMQVRFFRLSLSQQFLLLSFPILLGGTLLIGHWIGLRVQSSVVHRMGAVTALYVDSFIAPHSQTLLRSDDLTETDRAELARLLESTPLGQKVVSLKIWRPDGRVLFSTTPDEVGKTYPVDEGLAAALAGGISSELSVREDEEQQAHGQPRPRIIETYTPIHADKVGKIIAAAEFYEEADEVDREVAVAQRQSWLQMAGAMAAMYLLLFVVVRRGSQTIERQQRELGDKLAQLTVLNAQNADLHHRARRAAVRATALNENFLQRLSADLHDGPGQDLGFALMQLTTEDPACTGADGRSCRVTGQLAPVRAAVHAALADLRAISADLQLPDVRNLTLADLVARAVRDYEVKTSSSVLVECDVHGLVVPARTKITVCRVLQESLANAYRHARGSGCRVKVHADRDSLTVEVRDEGPGLAADYARKGRLGLVGMRERVEIAGGTLAVESAPGRGALVRAVLPLGAGEDDNG